MVLFYIYILLLTWCGLARFNVATTLVLAQNTSEALGNNFTSGHQRQHSNRLTSTRNSSPCTITIEQSSKDRFFAYGKNKDVKLLYLGLVFLNESNEPSFDGDTSRLYDPLEWVWTDSEQGRALLSLPYDYKILSCLTLSRDTRRIPLHILSKPHDCFGGQSPEWKLDILMGLLSRTANGLSVNSSVCHRFVEDEVKDSKVIYETTVTGLPRIRYKCCLANSPNHDCAIKITPNRALSLMLTMLWLVSCLATFFTPLLINYLPTSSIQASDVPNEGENSQMEMHGYNGHPDGEIENENISSNEVDVIGLAREESPRRKSDQEYITLNSSTPLGNVFEASRCLSSCPGLCPRLSRFLFFFVLMPLVLVTALVTYSFAAKHEVTLQRKAGIKTDFIQMCLNPDPLLTSRIAAYIFSCLLLCIPIHLAAVVDESVLLVSSLQARESCCVVCAALQQYPNRELFGHQLLYDNMLRHLRFLFSIQFWKVLFAISALPSRWLLYFFVHMKGMPSAHFWYMDEMSSYCIGGFSWLGVINTFMWILISPFWVIAFFCIACFILFMMIPIGYFYACICFVPLVFLVQTLGNNIFTWIVFFACFSLNLLSALFLVEMITFSWVFIFKLVGFTLMGLAVGIDHYIPYIVYAIAVVFYIQNFWGTLNDKYLKLKVLLFDECLKQHSVLLEEQDSSQALQLVIKDSKTELPMIPKELYVTVCRDHMPLRKILSSSLFNLFMILLFLSFVFASVMAFGKWADLPSLTEASLTAFLSLLPKLLRYQGKHTGKSMLKEKQLLHKLEVNVAHFVRKLRDDDLLIQL